MGDGVEEQPDVDGVEELLKGDGEEEQPDGDGVEELLEGYGEEELVDRDAEEELLETEGIWFCSDTGRSTDNLCTATISSVKGLIL